MKRILHITTHIGAGVGYTLLNYIIKDKYFNHTIVCLGYTTDSLLEKVNSLNITYYDNMFEKHKEIIKMIPNFDIVVIHVWNHPLLYDFLVRNELPECRLVMLGHNSGFYPPNIYTKKLLTYPDIFVFTTPLSYHIKELKELSYIFSSSIGGALEVSLGRHLRKKYFYSVWSTSDIGNVKDVKPVRHIGFNVGYIGTVDYAKMHPDFLKICDQVDIPNVKFIVVGGLKEKEIQEEAIELGIADKFIFTGWVKDTKPYMKIFDVFGYPLAPYHYGTCDLTLQEAMGVGIVPVVLDNPMEKHMVKNNKTGIVAKDIKSYVQAIKDMYNNINWRKELSDNAKEYAIENFSLKRIVLEWKKVFNKVLEWNKVSRKWDINKKEITAKDVFLESLCDYAQPFIIEELNRETVKSVDNIMKNKIEETLKILIESGLIELKKLSKLPNWQTETKGSVHNYHAYFPGDPQLARWSAIMKVIKNEKK